MLIQHLLRENIRRFKPYSSARLEYSGGNKIYLDANENSIGSVLGKPINRYPDPLQKDLKSKVATAKNVQIDNVFVGNGSDEAIDLLIRAFCEPGLEKILLCPPTYGIYSVSAAINNVDIIEIPLNKHFDINLENILDVLDDSIKIIFLCSPNNPTGNLISKKSISILLKHFHGLVVIDEAYIDFADDMSWLASLADYQNLVVLQTFSKAWGMANIRLGMAFGHPELIYTLNAIKYPYNVNGLSLAHAIAAFENLKQKAAMIRQILSQRTFLENSLRKLPHVTKVFHSDANFLLVRFKNSARVYQQLLDGGIIVRDRSHALNCENCLRITVGAPEENSALINLLKKLE